MPAWPRMLDVLEVELECLGEVGERLVDGRALAHHRHLDAAGHEPVVVGRDHGREVQRRPWLLRVDTMVPDRALVEEGREGCGHATDARVTRGAWGATMR